MLKVNCKLIRHEVKITRLKSLVNQFFIIVEIIICTILDLACNLTLNRLYNQFFIVHTTRKKLPKRNAASCLQVPCLGSSHRVPVGSTGKLIPIKVQTNRTILIVGYRIVHLCFVLPYREAVRNSILIIFYCCPVQLTLAVSLKCICLTFIISIHSVYDS